MLCDFLATNRTVLLSHCRSMTVGIKSDPKPAEEELARGIPMFLDQLIETLVVEQESGLEGSTVEDSNACVNYYSSGLSATAALHGADLFRAGFTIERVVRDYGDVCQAITSLALETGASISVDEFRTFNRCLDNAIASAVTEFAKQAPASDDERLRSFNSWLEPLARELRDYLQTATYAARAIRAGTSGATASVLDRSLLAMGDLIDRSLAEVRATAGLPPHL
jgi:hypothetical protein